MKKTCVVLIGNSDDKLGQKAWSSFVNETRWLIRNLDIHFAGGPRSDSEFQNFCLVFDVEEGDIVGLIASIRKLCEDFRQDSIAIIVGETEFIKPHVASN